MRVIARTRSLRGWRLLLTAGSWALAVNLGMRLVLVTSSVPPSDDVVYYLLLAFCMVLVPVPFLYSRVVARRILAFVAAYSFAVVAISASLSLLADFLHLRWGTAGWLFSRGGSRPVFVNTISLAAFTPPAMLLAWSALRWTRGPVREQDGTLCPGCGYCLVGVAVPVCPECGRGFSAAELGRIEASPALQKRLGIPVARAARTTNER